MELAEKAALFIGTWKLLFFESRTSQGDVRYPFGKAPEGTLIYTASGRFAVQLMGTDRPRFANGDQMKGTAEEIRASFEGCIAYYGTYALDPAGSFVVHQVERSLFPNWDGQGLKRFYELSGNRLKLTTPPTVWGGGGEVVSRLEWERLE